MNNTSQNTNPKENNCTWKRFVAWVNGEEALTLPKHCISEKVEKSEKSKVRKNWEETAELRQKIYRILSIVICLSIIVMLLITVKELPPFGSSTNPASNEVVERYIESGLEETGAVNIVAGMILDYRAFDTFGESAVLFLAVMCVVILMRRDSNNISAEEDQEIAEDEEFEKEDSNIILKQIAAFIVPLIFLFGIYVILNGHLSPGGGFSGGAIVGAGLILYSIAFGHEKVRTFFTFRTFTKISVSCLLTYCAAKGYSFFTGANHLHSIIPKGTPGNILSSGLILPLNICVGMIVACTMYGFYALFTKGDI
ncbi:MAG: hypothetical protein GX299_01440 [Epulopiscium sp.]|jgi:multicomponent Na+:H+ antiporter subunit B|nr:hypothetical protein [Candidatus Epulonipiscium sp.]